METAETAAPTIGWLEKSDRYLEKLYESGETVKIGRRMAESGLKNSPSQIRGLENLVMSARKFSDIINFIKNQTGKDTQKQWLKVGPDLLGQLEQLEQAAQKIGADDSEQIFDIKKRLARGWIKQIVAHYFYEKIKHA